MPREVSAFVGLSLQLNDGVLQQVWHFCAHQLIAKRLYARCNANMVAQVGQHPQHPRRSVLVNMQCI